MNKTFSDAIKARPISMTEDLCVFGFSTDNKAVTGIIKDGEEFATNIKQTRYRYNKDRHLQVYRDGGWWTFMYENARGEL